MNETLWLACGDPPAMLAELGERISDRKLRLFACACVRQLLHLVTDPRSRQALHVAERFADGLATEQERAEAESSALYASYDNSFFLVPALQAVAHTLAWDIRTGRQQPSAAPVEPENDPDDPNDVAPEDVTELEESTRGGVREVLRTLTALAGREAAYGCVAGESEEAQVQAARELEEAIQAGILREIVGNPYRPVTLDPMWMAWNDGCIPNMARTMLDGNRWEELPILADALEEAGCANFWLLDHLRGRGPHYRGCWALDQLLGLS